MRPKITNRLKDIYGHRVPKIIVAWEILTDTRCNRRSAACDTRGQVHAHVLRALRVRF